MRVGIMLDCRAATERTFWIVVQQLSARFGVIIPDTYVTCSMTRCSFPTANKSCVIVRILVCDFGIAMMVHVD